MKDAIRRGTGFIHTGGPGSFHGGHSVAACLDLTSLAEVLPVQLQPRNDLVLSLAGRSSADPETATLTESVAQDYAPITDISMSAGEQENWSDRYLKQYGVRGFNEVRTKSNARAVMTIAGSPLLVTGHYGAGRTLAFAGFTPGFQGEHVSQTYDVVDQQLSAKPANCVLLDLAFHALSFVTESRPTITFEEYLARREEPLFEMLKGLPPATVALQTEAKQRGQGNAVTLPVVIANGSSYARLVKIGMRWRGSPESAPFLTTFGDNFFDLFPGEKRLLNIEIFRHNAGVPAEGTVTIDGANVTTREIPVEIAGD